MLAAFSIYRWKQDQRGDPDQLMVSGTVEAEEVEVGSKVGGRILEVLVPEGASVQKGQLLARFDTAELSARQRLLNAGRTVAEAQEQKLRNGPRVQELAQARANLAAVQAQLAQLEHGSRPEDIAAGEASWRAAEAQASQAAQDLARAEQLFAQDVLPRSELDAARAREETAQRNADAAKQQFEKARAGPRAEEIAAARARVSQAQASYDLLAAGSRTEDISAASAQVEAASAELEVLGVQLAESKVFAPAAGTILTVNRQPGDLVGPAEPIFTLLLTDSYYVQVFIPANKLSWAIPGRQAPLTVDTFPGQIFSGTVTYLSMQGEFTPRNLQTTEKRVEQTFRCKLVIDDALEKLRPGMMCDVTFEKPQ
jgi:multidrug resistance efflux pump